MCVVVGVLMCMCVGGWSFSEVTIHVVACFVENVVIAYVPKWLLE